MTGRRPKGIFDGADQIIAPTFQLRSSDTLKQKSTCRRIALAPLGKSVIEALISDLYGLIENNRTDHTPSRENWRIKRQLRLNPKNSSPEILLERAIARLAEKGDLKGWYNQIPVASGLVDDRTDKRAAIDLMRYQDNQAELIELKWESDTPAFAAFEILRYGLAYLFSRVNREACGCLESPLMTVSEVSLRVLAPRVFYADCDLTWLGQGLDQGIRTLAATKTAGALTMGFGFLAFPPDFDRPFACGKEVLQMRDEARRSVVSAICGVEPVWAGKE